MPAQKKPQSTWFVRQTGKVYGPFDSVRMRKLAAAGKLLRDSGVAKQVGGPWTQASRVRGLFQSDAEAEKDEDTAVAVEAVARQSQASWWAWFSSKTSVADQPERQSGDDVWFYRDIGHDDEDAKGPCSRDEMARLVEAGQVRASTLVLEKGEPRWETAFSAGLFLDSPLKDDDEEQGHSSQSPAVSAQAAMEKEEILWNGKPSHHANYGTYAFCLLASPLVFPALWGLRKFVDRDCLRYQITSRRVRIKHGGRMCWHKDIPLKDIRDAAMVSPACLQPTNLCNIQLFGENEKKPLGVLEGIPLAESALVISLCEAAANRHIPLHAKERLLADAKLQEQELLRRAEERHQQEVASLRLQLQAKPFEWKPPVLPPPATRKKQRVSGLTSFLFGARKRTIWVKGHYRKGKWIDRHKREIDV